MATTEVSLLHASCLISLKIYKTRVSKTVHPICRYIYKVWFPKQVRNLSIYHILTAQFSKGLRIKQLMSRSRLFKAVDVFCNPTQKTNC